MAKKAKTAKTAKKAKAARPSIDKKRLQRGIEAAVDNATGAPPPPVQPFAGTMRAIVARHAREIPREAVGSGVHEPSDDAPIEAKDVPNGRYRVDGSEFIVTVKRQQVVSIETAPPTLDPASVIAIPSS
jgi:hypothetical protein